MNTHPCVLNTDFQFPGLRSVYHGKVRDVYYFDDILVVVSTDRISAFDHILPKSIPFKGQVLNQLAAYFLKQTSHKIPNWFLSTPDPNVTIGKKCEPIRIEMVVRGYLAGYAWRTYNAGERMLCGVRLPDGMKQYDPFPYPIITPATKAEEGHDEDISKEDIIRHQLVTPEEWETLEKYSLELFRLGTKLAASRNLILVDTKYEFGRHREGILLIDEVHTPDSSRYFLSEGYAERQKKCIPQVQLSKEFVREWLMERGFQGKAGQSMPDMPDEFALTISQRYIQLYEKVTGMPFNKSDTENIDERIYNNITKALSKII